MTGSLEDQIARYAEALDNAAPPVQELLPRAAANAQRSTVVEISLERSGHIESPLASRRGLAVAALVVAVVLLPAWLWWARHDGEVVTTTSTTDVIAVDPTEPTLTFGLSDATLRGGGWLGDTEITATMTGDVLVELTAQTDADGEFVLPGFDGCCTLSVLTVTDGEHTTTVRVDWVVVISRVDPSNDMIAGSLPAGKTALIRLNGPDGQYETEVQGDADGRWRLDLAGIVDVTPSVVVEARVTDGPLTLTWTTGVLVDPELGINNLRASEIIGSGWDPDGVVNITVNDDIIANDVSLDAGGGFLIDVADTGIDFEDGDNVAATDGTSERHIQVPQLAFGVLDPALGVVSGSTSMPDGSRVGFRAAVGPPGGPERAVIFEVTQAEGGQWEIEFDPIVGGDVVLDASVSVQSGDGFVTTPFASDS